MSTNHENMELTITNTYTSCIFYILLAKTTPPYKYIAVVIAGLVIIVIKLPCTYKLILYVVFTGFVVFLYLVSAYVSPGYLSNTLSEVYLTIINRLYLNVKMKNHSQRCLS